MTMPSIPGTLATTALCLAAVVGLGRAQKASAVDDKQSAYADREGNRTAAMEHISFLERGPDSLDPGNGKSERKPRR